MIALVEANALLWWLAGDRTLSRAAARAIRDPDNDVLVSAATIWEIEIKRSLGKLQAPDGITDAARAAGFNILPIKRPARPSLRADWTGDTQRAADRVPDSGGRGRRP